MTTRWILITIGTAVILTTSMLPTPINILFAFIVVIALIPAIPPLERWVYASVVRRAWNQAEKDSGAQVTHHVRVSRVRVGDQLDVRVRRGCSVKKLEQRSEELAGCLRVREVQVKRDDKDASRATITLVRKHAFDTDEPNVWPLLNAENVSLWDPIPVAVDEQGKPVSIQLIYRNMLIGGIPDSGKSVAQSLITAAGVLDPNTDLWLMDGKTVDLPMWKPAARAYAGMNRPDAIRMLRELQTVIQDRYALLGEHQQRKVHREDGHRLHLLIVDELAEYLHADTKEDRDDAATILELLRSIASQGRAAGVMMVLATQKPDADTVASKFRDLIAYRFALRCMTWQASDTVLGAGWATVGADASKVPNRQKGVGWLLAEDDPVRVRGYWLGDDDLRELVARSTNKAMA